MKKLVLFISLFIAYQTISKAQTCENCGIGTATPNSKLEIKGCGVTSATSSLNVTDSAGTSLIFVRDDGNVSIGTTSNSEGFRVYKRGSYFGLSSPLHIGASGSEYPSIGFNAIYTPTSDVYTYRYTGKTSLLRFGGISNAFEFKAKTSGTAGDTINYTNVMAITYDGKVGIGTASPSTMLDIESTNPSEVIVKGGNSGFVNATVSLQATGTTNYRGTGVFMHDLNGGNEWFAGRPYQSSNRYVIQYNDTNATHNARTAGLVDGGSNPTGTKRYFAVESNGNVGIGEGFFSGSKLEIHGSGTTSSTSAFHIKDYSGTSMFYVRDDKKIGIGTTSPTSRLQIQGTGTTSSTSSFQVTDNSGNSVFYVRDDQKIGIGTTTPLARFQVQGLGRSSSTIAFSVLDSAAGAYLISARDDGSVGIGTSNTIGSGGYFYVKKRGTYIGTSATACIGGSSSEYPSIGYNCEYTTTGSVYKRINTNSAVLLRFGNGKTSTSRAFEFKAATDGTAGDTITFDDVMTIRYDGNVGIGTTSPSQKLEVNGRIRTTDDAPEKPSAGSWTGYSDRRLKKDITPFSDGLNIIRNVNPVQYSFNGIGNLPSTENHIGVVAQDVQSVIPYCVKSSKMKINKNETAAFGANAVFIGTDTTETGVVEEKYETDVLTYNQDGLFYVMVNSIKELDAIVKEQQLIIADLKARIEKLESK